jgi:septation ring formation regulator EzrA
MSDPDELTRELANVRRELATIRQLVTNVVTYIRDAESEVPERMRRFVTYMHDVHDVTYMYEQRGLPIPKHILDEMERCDDRMRQLLEELHLEGNVFAKIRAEMAKDPSNRWDHTRLLQKPKENGA